MSSLKEKYEQFKAHVKEHPEFYCYVGGVTIGTALGFALRDGMSFPIRGDGFYASPETWMDVRQNTQILHTIDTDDWGLFVISSIRDKEHYNELVNAFKEAATNA